ncbi:MAG: hypothetical protein H6641_00880 [Caldilineaceae bacterium]|nr:hypothetical protein [Caldilineaceae bacterium]
MNRLKGKARNDKILADFNNLIDDLEKIDSTQKTPLILVKANICRLLENRLASRGFIVLNKGIVVPFPSTGQQKRFQTEMDNILK